MPILPQQLLPQLDLAAVNIKLVLFISDLTRNIINICAKTIASMWYKLPTEAFQRFLCMFQKLYYLCLQLYAGLLIWQLISTKKINIKYYFKKSKYASNIVLFTKTKTIYNQKSNYFNFKTNITLINQRFFQKQAGNKISIHIIAILINVQKIGTA